MAKVLFMENRGKTTFWALLSDVLENRGHSCSWLVQNHVYAPKTHQKKYVIPYPEKRDLSDYQPDIVAGDRSVVYFGCEGRHYKYYEEKIHQIIADVKPDIVIGEATLFHELIAATYCKSLGIPYLHPISTRYPRGKFQILDGLKQDVLVKSGDVWPEKDLLETSRLISENKVIPIYMDRPSAFTRYSKMLRSRYQTWLGLIGGERFNTPSFMLKMALDRGIGKKTARWDKLAGLPQSGSRNLLYPMQMQPESNLDLWGRPHVNQLDIVQTMVETAPEDVGVLIKVNPKTKYELSDAFLDYCGGTDRVTLLPRDLPMTAANELAVGTLTVTGTVAYEAIFGRGRCISLSHPIIRDHFADFHAPSIEAGVDILLNEPGRGRGSLELGAELLREIVGSSFEGLVDDPFFRSQAGHPGNVENVCDALEQAISAIGTR